MFFVFNLIKLNSQKLNMFKCTIYVNCIYNVFLKNLMFRSRPKKNIVMLLKNCLSQNLFHSSFFSQQADHIFTFTGLPLLFYTLQSQVSIHHIESCLATHTCLNVLSFMAHDESTESHSAEVKKYF